MKKSNVINHFLMVACFILVDSIAEKGRVIALLQMRQTIQQDLYFQAIAALNPALAPMDERRLQINDEILLVKIVDGKSDLSKQEGCRTIFRTILVWRQSQATERRDPFMNRTLCRFAPS